MDSWDGGRRFDGHLEDDRLAGWDHVMPKIGTQAVSIVRSPSFLSCGACVERSVVSAMGLFQRNRGNSESVALLRVLVAP